MFQQFRDLILRKCRPEKREEVRAVFDARPFGTLERLVAQKMLEVVQRVAREELDNEDWIRLAAQAGGRSKKAMRVMVLDFLDVDVLQVSSESCVNFLDPLVDSWSVDLETLRLDIVLERTLVPQNHRVFEFVEHDPGDGFEEEPGLAEFLQDRELAGQVSEAEVRLLRGHRHGGRRPNKLYYYRALQNLRDPLHFHGKE
jgi:hypothetical protein